MEKETLDYIAGEYVLGTLSNEERRAANERLKTDADFAHLVHEWEKRLLPLTDKPEPVAAPFGIWHKISDRLEEQPASEPFAPLPDTEKTPDNVTKLVASRNRWRAAFIGAMALAASFIGLQATGVYLPFFPKPAADGRFIAVLNPSGSTTGFVIRVDVGTKKLEIQRLANKAPTGKDYELWVIEPDKAAKSLNVVGRNAVQQVSYSNFDNTSTENQSLTFAITLEPEGGSPTGKATGPIVFSGQLITQ